jgi:hypothetical protein
MSTQVCVRRFPPETQNFSVMVIFALTTLLSFTSVAKSQIAPAALVAAPLVVDRNSHLVVMEYENWFGPKAVTFQGAAAMPVLQSKDMQRVGGGYDSADPAVIKKHLAWFEYLGIDVALI